jgi:hypothetical protein
MGTIRLDFQFPSEEDWLMKMNVLRDVAPCSLVEIDRRFIGAYCFHYHRLDDETSVNFYEITRRNIAERQVILILAAVKT